MNFGTEKLDSRTVSSGTPAKSSANGPSGFQTQVLIVSVLRSINHENHAKNFATRVSLVPKGLLTIYSSDLVTFDSRPWFEASLEAMCCTLSSSTAEVQVEESVPCLASQSGLTGTSPPYLRNLIIGQWSTTWSLAFPLVDHWQWSTTWYLKSNWLIIGIHLIQK